jgi:DNA-binding transcriptional regulator LsrR (DeoR family)
MPGPALYEILMKEPSIRRVAELWQGARCAVVGVGAPPLLRQDLPSFVPIDAASLRRAVGDVCSRFYDGDGQPLDFPGLERLVATPLAALADVEVCIAVAAGAAKVPSIVAGARAGYFTQLVTDRPTAAAVLAATGNDEPRERPA